MRKPLVSVVIPTYNRGDQLRTAVKSVLNQTYRNLELIVVDDCSKVPAASKLADIADPRLQVIRHDTNQKLSTTRNTGIARARGQYLAFLDDDDWWLPEKLERHLTHMRKLQNHPASVTNMIVIGGQIFHQRDNSSKNPEWMVATGSGLGLGSTLVVQQDAFHRVGLFDPAIERAEDWDWLLRYRHKGFRLSIMPEFLTVNTGAHWSSTTVELETLRRIKEKHEPLFMNDKLCGAFRAATMWKRARIELGERRYVAGLAGLAKAGLSHPIHAARFARVILGKPTRNLLRGRPNAPALPITTQPA